MTFGTLITRLAAAAIACAAGTPLAAASPDVFPPAGSVITLKPGQSVRDAMAQAAILARAAGLKAAWQARGGTSAAGPSSPPTINSGSVVSSALQVGDPASLPVLQFTYGTGSAGLNAAAFTFTSPDGQSSINLTYYQGRFSRKGSVVFSGGSGARYFAQPGTWPMTSAAIFDFGGNYTQYTGAQLAALFQNPALTVFNNGPVDITPPVVTAGKVLTPTVSISSPLPQFQAQLSGTDDVSGAQIGFIYVQPPGAPFSYTNLIFAPFAFTSGSMDVSFTLFPGLPTGTWSITGYELCDVAGNCAITQSAADVQALFGTTTFTVTP